MIWKEVIDPLDKNTGFLDKNGRPICVGDRIIYRKRVRADYKWDRKIGRYNDVPGFTKSVEAEVIGFGRRVKKFINKRFYRIEYINVKVGNSGSFRIYRCDRVFVNN